MSQMTICYWFQLHYPHTTMSVASYCAPARNCTPASQQYKCSNIQYHVENKQSVSELRVEFSISAVKTKSLKAAVVPQRWNHHCITYNDRDGRVTMYSGGIEQNGATLRSKVTAENGDTVQYHPQFPGEGILILGQEQERLCGGFDDYDSLSADISEFQIWNRILPKSEIYSLATCQSFHQGNVLNWIASRPLWSLSNIAAEKRQNLRKEFCRSDSEDKFLVVFPERRTVEMAEHTCVVHGGILPVPRNDHENRRMARLGKTFESVCSEDGKENLNQPYMWLGIEDPQGKGSWRARHLSTEVGLEGPLRYTKWDDNEGSEGDTCARMQGNGLWRDTVCKKTVRHCTTCHIKDPQQVFTLRGLCDDSPIDRGFFLINGKKEQRNLTRMRPIYEGYFSKIEFNLEDKMETDQEDQDVNSWQHFRKRDGSHGHWRIKPRIPHYKRKNKFHYEAQTNATSQVGYPVGRHAWLIVDPKCDLFEPTWLNLTLSRCAPESEFTCSDGLCIPSEQRCDLVQNCRDYSDELDCDTLLVPSTYLLNPPTDPRRPDEPMTVTLRLSIVNIDRIDTVHMMFALTMEVQFEWRDHRLSYKNLRQGLGQNQLTQEEISKIWRPSVSFSNAKIGQLEIHELGLMVRRESEPQPFSYEDPVEDKVYLGSENSLVISRKYYAEYGCTFDLKGFPFDDQMCTMNFTMDSAKANYIILQPDNITYQGESMLLEFQIKDFVAKPGPLVTEAGKSMVSISIMFHRELGNMVNTYFQTFLLCLMAYLTLYINLADFGNRFMGALTSLLVLASLLASIEENLPKTSYFKKIDIWFMSYIIFISIIIVFHICIDLIAGNHQTKPSEDDPDELPEDAALSSPLQPQRPPQISSLPRDSKLSKLSLTSRGQSLKHAWNTASSTLEKARRVRISRARAEYINGWGKLIFPIVLMVFTVLYFVLSLVKF